MWITGQPTSSMFSRFTDQEKVLHCVPDSTFPRAITLDWLVLQKRSARVSPRRTWPVRSRRDTVIEFSQSVITRAIDTNLYVRDLYSPSENLGVCAMPRDFSNVVYSRFRKFIYEDSIFYAFRRRLNNRATL